MIERKTTPCHEPMFYYHIAEATYRNQPDEYLDQAFGGRMVKVVDRENFGFFYQWAVVFFHDLERGEMIVGFRGTNNFLNWCSDVLHVIANSDRLFKSMGKVIKGWKKKYGRKISAFVGHSAGGYYTSHVKKKWPIHRITFNGHKCEREGGGGPALTINLRITVDVVSSKITGSIKDRYIKVQLPDKPNLLAKISQEVHKLRCFALVFAKNPEEIQKNRFEHSYDEEGVQQISKISWFEEPYPVEGRSWVEIAPKVFSVLPAILSLRQVTPLPKPSETSSDLTEKEEGVGGVSGESEKEPSSDPFDKTWLEVEKVADRTVEKALLNAEATYVTLLKNLVINGKKDGFYDSVQKKEFHAAFNKLNVAAEAKKAGVVFVNQTVALAQNALKQISCILISSGAINPLTVRCVAELFIALYKNRETIRRDYVSEALSSAIMETIPSILDVVIKSSGFERSIRNLTTIAFDQSPEELTNGVLQPSVKKITDFTVSLIPLSQYFDDPEKIFQGVNLALAKRIKPARVSFDNQTDAEIRQFLLDRKVTTTDEMINRRLLESRKKCKLVTAVATTAIATFSLAFFISFQEVL